MLLIFFLFWVHQLSNFTKRFHMEAISVISGDEKTGTEKVKLMSFFVFKLHVAMLL